MAKKPKETEQSQDEKALQERVDEMMDTKRNSTDVSKVAANVNEQLAESLGVDAPEEFHSITVRKSPKTAPELPGKKTKVTATEAEEPATEADQTEEQSTADDLGDSETDKAV